MSRKPLEFQSHPVGYEQAREWGMFRAVAPYIVDGDTWDLFVDMGLGEYAYKPVRLVGDDPRVMFDTAERNTELGKAAIAFCREKIQGRPLLIKTYRDSQSFERWLAQVFWVTGPLAYVNITDLLEPFRKPG